MGSDSLSPSEEDLMKLSLFGMVAYSVRCAQRVQPFYNLWAMKQEDQKLRSVIDDTIAVAKEIASGLHLLSVADAVAAHAAYTAATQAAVHAAYAAAHTADLAATQAAHAAYTAATQAAHAAAHAAHAAHAENAENAENIENIAARAADAAAVDPYSFDAAISDYKILLKLTGDSAGDLGAPIDIKALGPLWPEGEPQWYTDAISKLKNNSQDEDDFKRRVEESDPDPLISVCFDDVGFTDEEKLLFLEYVSELYRENGGSGLKLIDEKKLTPIREVV